MLTMVPESSSGYGFRVSFIRLRDQAHIFSLFRNGTSENEEIISGYTTIYKS